MDLKGLFLIAMPDLVDPNFFRTVIFMLDHGEDGSVGIVVNRDSALMATTLCESQSIAWKGEDVHVSIGGPVRPSSIWMLHGVEEEPSIDEVFSVCDGCWFSTSRDGLAHAAGDPSGRRRIFGGYAGWGAGQLVGEIRVGAWLTCSAELSLVFETSAEEMWEKALHAVGVDPASLVSGGTALQ